MAKSKKVKSPKRVSVPRTTHKFQLRNGHAEDELVAGILAASRAKRQAQPLIRDGIRLIWALQQWESGADEEGIEVLLQMFPRLRERFNPQVADLIGQLRMMTLYTPPEKTTKPDKPTKRPPPAPILEASTADTSTSFLDQFL
jgi:hypothetical protein